MDKESGSGRAWREALLFAALALALNWLGNGRVALWDRDEPRYAGCTREMMTSGDYINPSFNDEPRYHKPVLTYWFMTVGMTLGGDNPFGARMASGLMGAMTVILIWRLGRRLCGPTAGRLAALMFITAPMMFVESKLSTTDAILTFFLVACWSCLWELEQAPTRTRRLAALFWCSLALATLTKGPVGPAIIAVAGATTALLGGPRSAWRRLHWGWGVPLFLLIAAPWYIAIGIISDGEFYKVAMGYHVVQRMTTGIEQHGGFPGYYVLLAFVTLLPWSTFIPASLIAAWKARRSDPALGFLLGWLLGPLVLFEVVQTKLVHYYYPAMPAALLLVAWLVQSLASGELKAEGIGRWWSACRRGLLATGATLAIGGIAAAAWFPISVGIPALIVGALGIAAAVWGTRDLAAGQTVRAFGRIAGVWAVLLAVVAGGLLPALSTLTISDRIGKRLDQLSQEHGARAFLGTFFHPSTIYAFGRPIQQAQSRADIAKLARESDLLVCPLLPEEIQILKATDLDVEILEPISGFNIVKGRNETLHFALIRRGTEGIARSEGPVSKRANLE